MPVHIQGDAIDLFLQWLKDIQIC